MYFHCHGLTRSKTQRRRLHALDSGAYPLYGIGSLRGEGTSQPPVRISEYYRHRHATQVVQVSAENFLGGLWTARCPNRQPSASSRLRKTDSAQLMFYQFQLFGQRVCRKATLPPP